MDTISIVIIVTIVLFYAFLIGGAAKRNSTTSIIFALFGLLLLPVAHIFASYFVVGIANDAIKSCLTNHNNLVGTALSDNLGVFSFIGESVEEQLRESYTSDIQGHLAKAIEFRKWPQIVMYASFILVFVDLFCLYLRNSDSKKFILISRVIFTIVIGYFVYSGMILVYRISSTILDAKTYGIFTFFTGGDTFGYDVLSALAGVAMFVVPLGILHLFHFKCANRYFVSEENNDYVAIESEPTSLSTPNIAPEPHFIQHSQELPQEQSQSSLVEDMGKNKIETLDELLHAGILTEEEYHAEKSKIAPSQQDDNTKIGMLRKLKKLFDADILTPEEYDKEKMEILFTDKIPVWVSGKTKVETLIEYKKLLDAGILAQDEFDYTKMDILRRS